MNKKSLFKRLLIRCLNSFNLQIKQTQFISDIEYLYLLWIVKIFYQSIKVPGHILEIGVAKGRNSILFGKLLELTAEKWTRKYYGFDTFKGYPDDVKIANPWLNLNAWTSDSCRKKNVLKRIRISGLEKHCELIQGDCRQTLKTFLENYSDERINKGHAVVSLLYIDCNSYSAAIESMQLVYPYITPGGFIVIDEKRQGGESKALIDFAKLQKVEIKHDILGCPAYLKKPI